MKKGTIWMVLGTLLIMGAFSLTVYNIWDENRAEQKSMQVVEKLTDEIKVINENAKEEVPLYEEHPEMEMPAILINDNRYIGVLEIPTIGMKLPVMENWSYANLKIAPCRYEGSVYTGDFIVAGHDYISHFRKIKNLTMGDYAKFTDVDGNQFSYEVVEIEVIPETVVEDMRAGDWDMTLFTCTYSGQERMTIRFIEIE